MQLTAFLALSAFCQLPPDATCHPPFLQARRIGGWSSVIGHRGPLWPSGSLPALPVSATRWQQEPWRFLSHVDCIGGAITSSVTQGLSDPRVTGSRMGMKPR